MRPPTPTFRDALRDFRKKFLEQPPDQWSGVLPILARWEEHTEAESIWRKIDTAAKAGKRSLAPDELILFVLLNARELQDVERVIEGTPQLLRSAYDKAGREWKAGDAGVAAGVRMVADDHAALMDRAFGRKKRGAAQRKFIEIFSAMFRKNCGRPLDDVVRVLTEIVFNEQITIDAVRKAAATPTT
jgi:hypothetical protein